MGRQIPFGSIPKTDILPDGLFHFKVSEMKAGETKTDGRPSRLMYTARLEVLEPTSHKGLSLFERFVVGDDDDPAAELEETWTKSFGGRQLAALTDACNVAFADSVDDDQYCQEIKDGEVLAKVSQQVDDGKKNPKYKGQVRNRINRYFSLGEKNPEITSGN